MALPQRGSGEGAFPYYLRNNLAALFHKDAVAHVEVEGGHHVGIVKRCPADLCTSQLNRVHVGNGRHSTGSAHLEDNLPERCLGLFCLKLVGYCPTGTLGRHAEALLLGQGIDLQHDAIGGDGQAVPFLVPIVDVGEHLVQRADQPHVLAHLEAPTRRCLEVLIVSVAGDAFAQEIIEVGIQSTLCHGAAVLALECAAGCVAGIGEERLVGLLALGIEAVEGAPGHQHLTANLKLPGPVASCRQLQGDASYGAHIGGDIVALHAVATRHGPDKLSVLVVETDAEAIELQLAADLERRTHQSVAHPLPEVGHLLAVVRIAQAEHRSGVEHRLELVVQVAAHALRRTVRVEELGMPGLEVLQFVHQEVEFLVGNDRSILHIVAVVMSVQLIAKLQDACFLVHRTH